MASNSYMLAVDQGTSGTMVALLDEKANILDAADIPVGIITKGYDYVEQDPDNLVDSICKGVAEVMARHEEKIEKLVGIGVANQGESFLLWNAQTGKAVTPVISWQDCRAQDFCDRLQQEGKDAWFHQKTGLHLSNEWPALKVWHLLQNDHTLKQLAEQGNLCYGQLDAWFLYCLSGGRHYASDHSTASRSGFYNIHTQNFDDGLCEFFGASKLRFPALCSNTAQFEGLDLKLNRDLPWVGGGLDQAMALLGQGCLQKGNAKVTYGTCCACWMNSGKQPVLNDEATTSVAWKVDDEAVYALVAEGGVAGSMITWLQQKMSLDVPLKEMSDVAFHAIEQEGLQFIPAFNGLSAPYWNTAVRGTLLGITAGTELRHILRAGLDAVAYTVADLMSSLPPCEKMVAEGGMSQNEYLMMRQASVLDCDLYLSGNREGTIFGVGLLMAKSLGFIDGLEQGISGQYSGKKIDKTETAKDKYSRWKKAVQWSIQFYENEP